MSYEGHLLGQKHSPATYRLVLANLTSATINLVAVLRDHAKSDLVTPSDPILTITF